MGEEQRPVKKGELACASKQSCLGGEGHPSMLTYPGRPVKRPQVILSCEAFK